MPRKEWTAEERQAFGDKMRAMRQNKLKQTPQPPKIKEEATPAPSVNDWATPAEIRSVEAEKVAAPTPTTPQSGNVTLSADQFNALLAALSSGTQSKTSSFSGQQQTNAQGQVVGSIVKYEPSPDYYPNPIEELTQFFDSSPRTRRLAFSENYFLKWEVTSKPYDTKYGTSIIEPTFHMTLYTPTYDEQGNETGNYRVVSHLELNEDESEALTYAHSVGISATHDNMREVMDRARYERIKRWLLAQFFPENTFAASSAFNEEAIGGQVVKVVTKSSVVGFGNTKPVISLDELQ